MFTRLSDKTNACRPWLLLWVLPYLLLTVAGESLHNHGLDEQRLNEQRTTPLALAVHSGEPGSQQTLLGCDDASQSRGTHLHPHCLSCQWSFQSVGVPAATVFNHRSTSTSGVAPHTEHAFASSFSGITSTRGPPLS